MRYPLQSTLSKFVQCGWGIQIMKLLIMKFSRLSSYLVPFRPKYSPQHPILKHPQFTFLTQCQRPSFTPIKYNRKNYNSVYFNLTPHIGYWCCSRERHISLDSFKLCKTKNGGLNFQYTSKHKAGNLFNYWRFFFLQAEFCSSKLINWLSMSILVSLRTNWVLGMKEYQRIVCLIFEYALINRQNVFDR
jgi:hypothetical protein